MDTGQPPENAGANSNSPDKHSNNNEDYFEDILNLEDQYHREGYALGLADGATAGRTEGRVFGLEKGFEKFVEMGRLQGMAAVWQNRLPPTLPSSSNEGAEVPGSGGVQSERQIEGTVALPPLNGSERLRRHVERLGALTEAGTFSTENTEEGVAEVDDRVKDAKVKATLIEKIVGETEDLSQNDDVTKADASGKASGVRIKRDEVREGGAAKGGDVEDFALPKHLR